MPNDAAAPFSVPPFAVPVTAVAVSPDGRYGASGDRSGEVGIWDLRHGNLIASVRGPHHGRVTGAAFTTDTLRPGLLTQGPDPILWTIAAEAMEWRRLPYDGGRLFDHDERASLLAQLGANDWIGLFGPLGGMIRTREVEATALTASGLIITGGADGDLVQERRRQLEPVGDPHGGPFGHTEWRSVKRPRR